MPPEWPRKGKATKKKKERKKKKRKREKRKMSITWLKDWYMVK